MFVFGLLRLPTSLQPRYAAMTTLPFLVLFTLLMQSDACNTPHNVVSSQNQSTLCFEGTDDAIFGECVGKACYIQDFRGIKVRGCFDDSLLPLCGSLGYTCCQSAHCNDKLAYNEAARRGFSTPLHVAALALPLLLHCFLRLL